MLKRLTLAKSIIAVVMCAFVVATWSVILIADHQFRKVADQSQTEVYAERIDKITAYLKERDQRLLSTGQRDAYIESFQQSAVNYLRRAYNVTSGREVYPFVQQINGVMILHPELPTGDTKFANSTFFQKALRVGNGQFNYEYFGEPKWAIVKTFEPWGWLVGFAVPQRVKYLDARALRLRLAFILGVITLLTLLGVSVVIWLMTKPIRELTNAADAISKGNMDFPTPIAGTGDIKVLALAFVAMRKSVRERIKQLNHEVGVRKQAETDLSKLQKYLANIIDSMPSAIVAVNTDCVVTQWNKEAEKLVGLKAQEALGHSIETVMPHMADKLEWIREAIRTREIHFKSKQIRDAPGMTRFDDITIYPLFADELEGAVIRIDDVTKRVKLDQVLVQSEKILSVGGLAAGMAHEINNPLGIMMQASEGIERRLSPNVKRNLEQASECGVDLENLQDYMKNRGIHGYFEGIKEAGSRASTIINNMLSFSRKSESNRSPHSIEKILDKVIELASKDYDLKKKYDIKKFSIIKEYAQDLPLVNITETEIEQVIFNIIKNAVQAMSESGIPTDDNQRITIKTKREHGYVGIEIEDNGPGINEDVRKRIFDPFFTTKPVGVGTGLGLSVSFFIITENHGGNLEVYSQPGEWTRFEIKLPLDKNLEK